MVFLALCVVKYRLDPSAMESVFVVVSRSLRSESKLSLVYFTSTSILKIPVDASYAKSCEAPKCALTSDAEGPVYVITPVVLLYVRLPSPPASTELIDFLTSESNRDLVIPALSIVFGRFVRKSKSLFCLR